MKQIRSRIYYEKSSGVILVITPEKEGFVQEMSKKQDMEIYEELKFRDINDIDYIELEYGKLKATFDKAKSWSVNLKTNQLEIIYFTSEELTILQQQKQEIEEFNIKI